MTRLRPLAIITPALAAALAVFAACGGDDSTPAVNTPTRTAAGPTATPREKLDQLKVVAKDFAFSFDLTSVHAGLPGVYIELTNQGTAPHRLAFYSDSSYKDLVRGGDSGPTAPGTLNAFQFAPPSGTTAMYYRCEIHPTQMKGEIKVTG